MEPATFTPIEPAPTVWTILADGVSTEYSTEAEFLAAWTALDEAAS